MVPDLRLTGTMSDAGLAGSIAIVDDGRIRVSGRSYRLRESAIVFTPEQGLVPRLNVFGETRIGDYDVTVRLSGPADAIETSLSSNPPLSDRDLQSLVVTGQTAGLTGETANNDAFAVGAVSGDVLGFAGQFVGLDSVRVGSSDDLELVSSDVEPSTRLTVSKRFGQPFELVLSENLDDSELTWVIIYRPRPGYQVRLSSREGEENTVEFRQELTFGPGSSLRPAVVRVERVPDVVAGITVSGDPGFSPSEVRDALELREGDRFDFREWSRDRDRVQRLYYDRGYYAVHVTPTRKVGDATSKRREVTLDYRILRGPRTELEVIGYPSSARLAEILKNAWNDALLPELLAQDLERATRAHLNQEGYLSPHVDVTLDNSRSGVQRALVQVTPGARITIRQLTFDGNRAISTSALQTLASEGAWPRRYGTIPLRWSRKSSPNMPREVTWRRRLQWATFSSRAIARRCLSSSRRGRSPASRRSRSQGCRPRASKAHRPRSVSRSAHRLRRAPSGRHVSDSSATTATAVIAMCVSRQQPAWRSATDV